MRQITSLPNLTVPITLYSDDCQMFSSKHLVIFSSVASVKKHIECLFSLDWGFQTVYQSDLSHCKKQKDCKVIYCHCSGGGEKGKGSLLDGQVTNPWPLSSTLESLTSVSFSRLLSLPPFCQRNLIMAGGGMRLPKVAQRHLINLISIRTL